MSISPVLSLRDDVPRALGAGAGAALAVGGLGVALGAPVGFLGAVLLGPAVAAVHVALLTVPALVVAQPLCGLSGTPEGAALAVAGGVRQGAMLLLATLPLVLFFGVSLGTAAWVVGLGYAAWEVALAVALVDAGRRLWRDEPSRGPAAAVYGLWVAIAWAVGTASGWEVVAGLGGAP